MTQSLWEQQWPAPAKLNLMLRIIGRRDDGYHILQTVFQIIDRCDELRFTPREDDNIVMESSLVGVQDADNLIIRAARMLHEIARGNRIDVPGLTIALNKILPMGGGLGGGSSDAATTLVVLNKLWNLQLTVEQLAALGVQLGADVPVFVYGNNAWAEGVGEILQPINLPQRWYIVLVPDCHVSTKTVFEHRALTRNSKSIRIDQLSVDEPHNDCLDVVASCHLEVKQAIDAVSCYPVHGLTGTGACVFAAFNSEQEASQAAQLLQKSWSVFVTRACQMSPLHEKLSGVSKN